MVSRQGEPTKRQEADDGELERQHFTGKLCFQTNPSVHVFQYKTVQVLKDTRVLVQTPG